MRELLTFLKEHPLAWMLPLGIALALLGWLAWSMASTPENPFAYRAY